MARIKRRVTKALPKGLLAASEAVQATRYDGTRSAGSMASQMRKTLDTLCEVLGPDSRGSSTADVTPEVLARCIDLWDERDELSCSTITKRLCILSSMGVNVKGSWVSGEAVLKWWLTPDNEETLLKYLRANTMPIENADITADFIEWTCYVGLRVEESLRLLWSEVNLPDQEMTVPGTKTHSAQATLWMPKEPTELLRARYAKRDPLEPRVFPISYKSLDRAWQKCRAHLGVSDNPLATLKALRRTAARYLTTQGMPTEGVRAYLRHDDIETTMGYLRLVGGYSTQEQRKWLTLMRPQP